jgi:hypothetical protein
MGAAERPLLFHLDCTVTDDERFREVSRLIVEAFRLSNTHDLASVHRILGLAAIEAAQEVSVRSQLPPNVVPLRKPRLRMIS